VVRSRTEHRTPPPGFLAFLSPRALPQSSARRKSRQRRDTDRLSVPTRRGLEPQAGLSCSCPWPTVLSASCCNDIVEHLEAGHQTHMRALLDQKDVVRLLRLEVNRAGSQKKWAKKIGVTQSLISMVLSGDRPPNNKIISALKLRRVVAYERLDRTAGRTSAPTRQGHATGRGIRHGAAGTS
jgi:hypothetical protein